MLIEQLLNGFVQSINCSIVLLFHCLSWPKSGIRWLLVSWFHGFIVPLPFCNLQPFDYTQGRLKTLRLLSGQALNPKPKTWNLEPGTMELWNYGTLQLIFPTFALLTKPMKLALSSLTQREGRTFSLHMAYSVIEGVIAGVLALNEFVFIRSLLGTSYQLGVLFQFSMVVFLALIFINEFLKRIRNKKKLLRITAILTRAPLLLLLFFPRSAGAVVANPIYH